MDRTEDILGGMTIGAMITVLVAIFFCGVLRQDAYKKGIIDTAMTYNVMLQRPTR